MRGEASESVLSDEGGGGQSVDEQRRRGLARPVSRETANLLLGIAGLLFATAGVAGLILALAAPHLVEHPTGVVTVCVAATLCGTALVVAAVRDLDVFHRHTVPVVYSVQIIAPILIALGQYAVGPRTQIAVLLYVETPIFAFYLLPRTAATAVVALAALGFGVVVAIQPGYVAPFAQWLFVVASMATIGALIGGLLSRTVEESMRLSRLRRFLAPQVAEAVLSAGDGTLLEPHRRQIAVLFCDLRGYTRFSGSAEPEEIVDMLDEYYQLIGGLLRHSEATIGSFGGDGIMAYFNDPVRCEDPAGKAVEVALDLAGPMETFLAKWRRRGFRLSYGVGVALGYATLGVIGFEGRHDYTPLGSVVNLAARLSDEAGPGEILVDQRTFDAVCERCDAAPVTLELKGFNDRVTAYRVSRTVTKEAGEGVRGRATGKERVIETTERRA